MKFADGGRMVDNACPSARVCGSISESEMQEFISEIDAIKGQMRAHITLHACDSELASQGPWVYEPWEEFSKPRDMQGGGGTSGNR